MNIDDAVTKKHSHTNVSVLNDISDSGGSLTYKGNVIGSGSGTSTGDMLKSIYDIDNNGIVDVAAHGIPPIPRSLKAPPLLMVASFSFC